MKQACERGWSISTAESCTGGLFAALLTDIEGCSHAFDRGFVVYTEKAKVDLLGLDAGLLKQEGAVSAEVAIAMAEGAMEHSDADIVLAVTGFAGPAEKDEEEGRVHFALARRGGGTRHLFKHFGPRGRETIRQLSLVTLLGLLEEALKDC
ncbi:MAG: CinA family protein [Rhodobacterales bacterium]|nr:CinA family protein [Rhodobacterales bacterium]